MCLFADAPCLVQFLMQQLAEEIQKMHVALTEVLDRLPNARQSMTH